MCPPGGNQDSNLLCHNNKVESPLTTKVVAVKSRVMAFFTPFSGWLWILRQGECRVQESAGNLQAEAGEAP